MGLFTKKSNDRLDILEKTQENLEQTQKNLETINHLMLTRGGDSDVLEEENSDIAHEDIEPLQAAYALNLCTVSVTQIIDYMDLNIMEQEYDTILNNLNLQNMPDDDALLDILKQILNTVTFFKIEQKEKEFVERDYQQKMKNAVWSAVPNIGALVATGLSKGHIMSAVSIAASVGTAYMSYRKQKAENKYAYDKEMWQLEKSAIEQFDGLKRELFDTAWRLAKHYNFKEKYRLTERLIHQYNAILMDADNDRKYARLEAISGKFEAYPEFWYHFGHTANIVALEASQMIMDRKNELEKLETKWAKSINGEETQIAEEIAYLKQEIEDLSATVDKYQNEAKKHFEYYQSINRYGLLREDKIASTCYLEYVELMIQMGKTDETVLTNRIEDAAKYAGESLEVLQLCVFTYMKLGDVNAAEKYLKILVNENYNSVMNAQILSSLYVHQYFEEKSRADARWKYSVLSKRVPSVYLFPMPKGLNVDKTELEKQFVYVQKFSLARKYVFVLNELTRKYALCFNKCIPHIDAIRYDNESFEDTYESRSRMCTQIIRFVDRDKADTFRNKLMQKDIFESYTEVIQEYFYKLYGLLEDKNNRLVRFDYQCLQEDLLSPIYHHNEEIMKFRLSIQNPDTSQKEIVDTLFGKYTFMFFVKDMLTTYTEMISERISKLANIAEISSLESTLLQFCNSNSLPMPTELYSVTEIDTLGMKPNFLFEQMVGGSEYNKLKEKNKLREEIGTIIMRHCKERKIIIRNNKSRLYVRGINDNDIEIYLNKIKNFNTLRADVLAIIEERGTMEWFNYTDLWLTTEGIAIVKEDKAPTKIVPYTKVIITDKDIQCGGIKYSNSDDVDMGVLRDIIVEIGKIYGEKEENHDIKHVDFANQCFEAFGGEENPSLCLSV